MKGIKSIKEPPPKAEQPKKLINSKSPEVDKLRKWMATQK